MKKLFVIVATLLAFVFNCYAQIDPTVNVAKNKSVRVSNIVCNGCGDTPNGAYVTDNNINTNIRLNSGIIVVDLGAQYLVNKIQIEHVYMRDYEIYIASTVSEANYFNTAFYNLFDKGVGTNSALTLSKPISSNTRYILLKVISVGYAWGNIHEIRAFETNIDGHVTNQIVEQNLLVKGTLKIGGTDFGVNKKVEIEGSLKTQILNTNNIDCEALPLKINYTSKRNIMFGGPIDAEAISATSLTLPTLTFPASTQTLKFNHAYGVNTIESSTDLNIKATGKSIMLGSNSLLVAGNNSYINLLNATSGINGLQIVYGDPAKPERRGIQITPDPDGQFNFWVNNWQSNASFNFKEYHSNSTLLTIKANDGSVGIGTTNTNGYKLAVKGKIICTEFDVQETLADNTKTFKVKNGMLTCNGINIKTTVPQSDFVFKKDYKLRSLKEVEKFVVENQHLPEIPSADDFMKNGYGVGQMDDLLLRKIEEQTLYIIDLNKRLEAVEAQLAKFKNK